MLPNIPHYCVVGGGLSGLSVAYLISLVKPLGSYRLSLFESSDRFGGWIHSVRSPTTGAIYELGPHTVRFSPSTDQSLFRFTAGLGLRESQLMIRQNTTRYIYHNGQLSPVTARFIYSLLEQPIYRLILDKLLAPNSGTALDSTVDEFWRRRFDPGLADVLGSALTRGVFAGDSRELGVQACFPDLYRMANQGPNLLCGILQMMLPKQPKIPFIPSQLKSYFPDVKSPSAVAWSLRNGMQSLTDAMVNKLKHQIPHVSLHLNSKVNRLDFDNSKFSLKWIDKSGNLNTEDNVDGIFLTCPSFQSAEILRSLLDTNTANRLTHNCLPWTDIAVGALEIELDDGVTTVQGFGHLVPRTAHPNILGVIYDSSVLPELGGTPSNAIRYTVMMKPYEHWYDLAPDVLRDRGTTECVRVIREQLRLNKFRLVSSHFDLLRNCIPQYPVNHLESVQAVRNELHQKFPHRPGIHLVGFSYDGAGLPSVFRSALDAVIKEFHLC